MQQSQPSSGLRDKQDEMELWQVPPQQHTASLFQQHLLGNVSTLVSKTLPHSKIQTAHMGQGWEFNSRLQF